MAPPSSSSSTADPNAVKIALALALLRFKKHHQSSPSSSSASDAQRWKKKAKERKREILRLREELKQLEDGRQDEDLSQIAACKCRFFDDCGGLRKDGENGGNEHWINEVLRRRFLRLVRWKERRKRVEGSLHKRHLLEFNNENEIEQLGTSIDFLVELSDTISVKGGSDAALSTLSHQATDFILASLKNLLPLQKDNELIEDTVNGLIMRLMRRMCGVQEDNGSLDSDVDGEFYVQHLIRKLGTEHFVGQRVMLVVSQKISVVADSLLVMDPFDNAFPGTHGSMYMMIQLIEFLILDSLQSWTSNEDFDKRIFEEWVRSILQARKSLELLECRNSLYMLYMERVIGELVKQLESATSTLAQEMDIHKQGTYSGRNASEGDSKSGDGEESDVVQRLHRIIKRGKGGRSSTGGGFSQIVRQPPSQRKSSAPPMPLTQPSLLSTFTAPWMVSMFILASLVFF